jgi:hypothetical protein
MPVARGIVKQLESSRGGGFHVTKYVHQDGSPSHSTWAKSRMVFPTIEVGNTLLKKSYVAIDAVGDAINDNIGIGDDVALYYFRHILWNHVIIGLRSQTSGFQFAMPKKGYFGALLWYGLFSALGTTIAGTLLGFFLASMTGISPLVLLGLLGGLYLSWSAFFRFRNAYNTMRADGL